ncbi:MAG: beta-lactamase family protein [Acidobacteria bacterium]|nr:beta-lactamase family protein [Acidobacteriota bacterium]
MNRRRSIVLFLSVLLTACSPNPIFERPPRSDDPRFERVADLVAQKMVEYGVPGVALGVSHEGKTITRGFGVVSVDNPLRVTDETLFQIGSISKTFTGTLVMRLVEEGKLKLDEPVRTYIPTFKVADEAASRQATVLTTLTHMGGWEGDLFIDTGGGDDALKLAVDQMKDSAQVAPINAVWSYNNAGFYVAGRLIELAAGKPYEQALKEMLLDPIGLQNTYIFPADVMTKRFAVGHSGPVGKLAVARPWHLPRGLHAVGGVIADVKDLLRYGQFHLGDGTTASGARILSADSMQKMKSTQLVKHGMDDEMAITWHISNDGGIRQVSHGGSTTGQQALLTLVPDRSFAVALLTNSGRGSSLNRDITRALIKEYLGVTITDPVPINTPAAELAQYVGFYTRPQADVRVTQDGDRLMIQTITKRGFPTPSTPVPPPGPPTAFKFYAKDRLIGIEGASKGSRAEIIRKPDGSIGWIRLGRIHARQSPGTTS